MGAAILEPQDVEAALGVVERFARERLASVAARPELQPDEGTVAAITDDAEALGLMAGGDVPGIWGDADDGPTNGLSIRALAVLAEADAGLAYHLHQRALGRWLASRMGEPGPLVPSLQCQPGLTRTALVRALRGAPLDALDRERLVETMGPSAGGRTLTAAAGWRRLTAPIFDPSSAAFTWRVYARGDLEVTEERHQHGLDALRLYVWRPRSPDAGHHAAHPVSYEPTLGALARQALGLVAIATGSSRRALALASDHASRRVQGGVPIQDHAAVQLLLGGAHAAVRSVEAMLAGVASAAPDPVAALAIRATAHPLLCDAANDALQVLGGSGYMRDVGLERRVRDCNHLRVMDGSPRELRLFLAAWRKVS